MYVGRHDIAPWSDTQLGLDHRGRTVAVRIKSVCWTVSTSDSTVERLS